MMTRIPRLLLPSLLVICSLLPAQPAHVEIDAGKIVRPIDPRLFGVNTARWDESLFPSSTDEILLTVDRDAIGKIKASGVTVLKYPGGNDADQYVWNSKNNNATEMNTDEYIALCRAVGAEPFITVNFNESPGLASAWVRYCNAQRGYNVKLWEVGDEQWGTWARGHAPPEEYAKKYIGFVKAMRAADPSIKIATNVPLGAHPENWTERVLKAAGEYVDMITFTYFPQQWGKENDDSLLATVGRFRTLYSQLREQIAAAVGPKRAAEILTVNVGYNSVNHSPGPQTLQVVNAVWTADLLGSMAELGTDVACFWALHNSYPPRGGDFGYLSSDGTSTPSYSYYAFPLLTQHLKGSFLKSACDDESISCYASLDGKALSAVLINKNKKKTKVVAVQLAQFLPQSKARVWLLDAKHKYKQMKELENISANFTLRIPPYSVTAVEVVSSDSIARPRNLALIATATASSYSTIGPYFKPHSAIDGNSSTRWNSAAWTNSNGDEKQWFQLAWSRPQRIGFVRIRWGESSGVDYTISTSLDGKRWHAVMEVKGGPGATGFSFDPVAASFLRIDGRRGSKGISAYSIRELEVYEHSQ